MVSDFRLTTTAKITITAGETAAISFFLSFFWVPVHFGEYMQLYAFMACIFCGMFAEYGFIAD